MKIAETISRHKMARISERAKGWQGLRLALLCAMIIVAAPAGQARAASGAPQWQVSSNPLPSAFSVSDNAACEGLTGFPAGEVCAEYSIVITNVGDFSTSGKITVTDMLPHGLSLGAHGLLRPELKRFEQGGAEERGFLECPEEEPGSRHVRCETEEAVAPGDIVTLKVPVILGPGVAEPLTNRVEVVGGGAPAAEVESPTPLEMGQAGFGVAGFSVNVLGGAGEAALSAGQQPAAVLTRIDYNTRIGVPTGEKGSDEAQYFATEEPKTEIVDLPEGFLGNPLTAPRCPEADLLESKEKASRCPLGSVLGTVAIELGDNVTDLTRLYNVTPELGYPAEFGFEFDEATVYMRARVLPTARGYVLSVSVPDVPRSETLKVLGVSILFFGNPGVADGTSSDEPFFRNPTACEGPLSARVEADSWVDPGNWQSAETPVFAANNLDGVTGCNQLQFDPGLNITPETTQADTPSGYEVKLTVPQQPDAPGDLASSDLRDAEVTLPKGVAISPGAADGLVGCQESGSEGIELGSSDKLAGENLVQEGEEEGPDALVHPARGHCPLASQVGEADVKTPLLAEPLHGQVYVAEPKCGGAGQPACSEAAAADGELFGLYLELEGSGLVVKLKGQVLVNPRTGQITTRFEENPQFPFSELSLKLKGGPRAPLANPQACGEARTTSSLLPWSAPESGGASTPFSAFTVTGCGGGMGFAPGFLAENVNPAAGAFSPFTVSFSRHDGEQDLSGISVHTPPGLLGRIAGIPQCGEVEANAGTCSEASRLGTATAAAGAGSHPFYQSGGVYLTGPYNGAPFGLSIVVPANAGPFHLGNIVVRAAIHIDPHTAQITVVSDPLPQMIDGVPLRVQSVNVEINRPAFMFNPTDCAGQSVGATIAAAQGAVVGVSSPFAASDCKSLPFKPGFSASSGGKASKAGGASLDVKVSSKGGPQPGGGEANIAAVKVDLPKQLPSRLSTLQKACLAAQFESNPAGCPKASDVGTASAVTPLLANPVSGPAYLVSHGNEAFPDLEIVLQGEGVVLILDGKTDIKKGITSSTFATVPDAPISSFELKLPTGRFSILGTNLPEKVKYNLCGQSLAMPTAITGQNGAVVKQATKIGVSGCPKVKAAKKTSKSKSKSKTKGK